SGSTVDGPSFGAGGPKFREGAPRSLAFGSGDGVQPGAPGLDFETWDKQTTLGGCRRSRGCSDFGAADGRLVVEATMRSLVVVVVGPWLQAVVSLQGVGPVFCVGPFAQGGLDEALRLAIGSGCVRSGSAMLDGHLLAGLTELSGAVTGAVVSKQGAHADAVHGEELDG